MNHRSPAHCCPRKTRPNVYVLKSPFLPYSDVQQKGIWIFLFVCSFTHLTFHFGGQVTQTEAGHLSNFSWHIVTRGCISSQLSFKFPFFLLKSAHSGHNYLPQSRPLSQISPPSEVRNFSHIFHSAAHSLSFNLEYAHSLFSHYYHLIFTPRIGA